MLQNALGNLHQSTVNRFIAGMIRLGTIDISDANRLEFWLLGIPTYHEHLDHLCNEVLKAALKRTKRNICNPVIGEFICHGLDIHSKQDKVIKCKLQKVFVCIPRAL